MPIYDWKCDDCGATTSAVRPMKDYEIPPDNGCEQCNSKSLKRTIVIDPNVKNFTLTERFGGHDREYTKTRSRN